VQVARRDGKHKKFKKQKKNLFKARDISRIIIIIIIIKRSSSRSGFSRGRERERNLSSLFRC
jgi:hypothetical protein|tara:strand:+ start:294 stop:479 length:186 start_codon:yes stop_codon:yes gene_type:complete